jgi:hypothetical protein
VVLGLLGAIAVGLIIYAGFTIMTAAGSEDKVGEGKKILVNAVIGLIIVLSAMGIVQFVLSSLSDATGSGLGQNGDDSGADGNGTDVKKTFSGSSSLGKIIKDHYPTRDQKDVARNTKIAITFNEPINPASIMENTNNTCWGADGKVVSCADGLVPYYGDCLFDKQNFSWEKDCDQILTTNVQIYRKADAKKELTGAATLAMYDAEKKMYTFTFRPLKLLGDDKQNTVYVVDLTSKIIKDNEKKTSAFEKELSGHYIWEFETGVNADFTPPLVTSVYPGKATSIDRNSIVQIHFSEAVDPTIAQGKAGLTTAYFAAVFANKNLTGEWRLSNGYKTLEFISDQACGENSCGETMFCLPVPNCKTDDQSCKEEYALLLRTGELLAATGFDGKPGSGFMDMAGNTLDGNANNKPEGRPKTETLDAKKTISDEEKKPIYDNYWWDFSVKNTIDLSSPYIHTVTPGLDAEGVNGPQPVEIFFSKVMMSDSLYSGISIDEYPQAKNPAGTNADWWVSPGMQMVGSDKSKAIFTHREFGPNGQDLYYFVAVSSSLKSVNQNCFYPGIGPYSQEKGDSPKCALGTVDEKNCVPVEKKADIDTGCSVTDSKNNIAVPDIFACLNKLKSLVKPAKPTGN